VGTTPTFFTWAVGLVYSDSEAAFWKLVKLDPRIQEIIERVATREGLELVHAELVGSRKNAVLRIYIDKPGGVNHEDCATVSDQVGLILDVEDLISHQYMLEVASPGLDRGLYKPADYERFAGLPAHIRLTAPLNGQRNFHGTLVGLEREGELAALLDDETGSRHRLPLNLIAKANVEIEP
jgi:ribosome maturation factor RimP